MKTIICELTPPNEKIYKKPVLEKNMRN